MGFSSLLSSNLQLPTTILRWKLFSFFWLSVGLGNSRTIVLLLGLKIVSSSLNSQRIEGILSLDPYFRVLRDSGSLVKSCIGLPAIATTWEIVVSNCFLLFNMHFDFLVIPLANTIWPETNLNFNATMSWDGSLSRHVWKGSPRVCV